MKNNNYTKDTNGLQKMRTLIDGTKVFMMATNLMKIPFSVCPMTLQEMDKQGDLWFFTARDSDHFRDIEKDNKVQLISSNEKEQHYLSIFGNATHIIDDKKINQLWNPILSTWFTGKDDPNLALININIVTAQYWDSNVNKLIALNPFVKDDLFKDDEQLGEKGHISLQNH